jgi:hypothetical protein
MASQEILELQRAILAQTEAARSQATADLARAEAERLHAEEVRKLREAEEERIKQTEMVLKEIKHTNELIEKVLGPHITSNAAALRIILEIQRIILPRLVDGDHNEAEIVRLMDLIKTIGSYDLNINASRDVNIDGDINN